MINIIWGLLIIIGSIFCILTGKIELLNNEILKSTHSSFDMILKLLPVIALWLGIMKIAEKSLLLKNISKFISPLLRKIFPEIPKDHESLSLISSNIIANMFGLGNAATPFGLKAMTSLQELNTKKDTASRSMITFLVLNTSGVTIIPTTIISLRMLYKSVNPTEVVLACILATFLSTCAGLLMDVYLAKRR